MIIPSNPDDEDKSYDDFPKELMPYFKGGVVIRIGGRGLKCSSDMTPYATKVINDNELQITEEIMKYSNNRFALDSELIRIDLEGHILIAKCIGDGKARIIVGHILEKNSFTRLTLLSYNQSNMLAQYKLR
jgi:hypothetical protein